MEIDEHKTHNHMYNGTLLYTWGGGGGESTCM